VKHIKKRFFLETNLKNFKPDPKLFDVVEIDNNFDQKSLNNKKGSIALIATDKDIGIGGFVHKVNGKNYIFPVPDPTLIYFHNAQISIAHIKKSKSDLLEKLDFSKTLNEPAINEIYTFYSLTCAFVIFLFTSIESFINQMIRDDYTFTIALNKKTEVYNKKQIQEFLDFKTKITDVLSDITNKNFFRNQTPTNQLIWNLKEFRDNIIHTKQGNDQLYKKILSKQSLKFADGLMVVAPQ